MSEQTVIIRSTSLEDLQRLVGPLVGQRCWQARLGFADALNLHLGKQLPFANPLIQGEKGEWVLDSRGGSWRLVRPGGSVVTSDDDAEDVRRDLAGLEGGTVAAIRALPALGLELAWDNGHRLQIIPTDDDLPCWELFTPFHMVLTAGPRPAWSWLRSDQPRPREQAPEADSP